MKAAAIILIASFSLLAISGCSKNNGDAEIIPIPNGDFEYWNSWPILDAWRTNSYPLSMSPIEMYIVRKDSAAYNGQFAAKFIHNSWAENKFAVSTYPTDLVAYVKSDLPGIDTVRIGIEIYRNNTVVGSGQWTGSSTIPNYTPVNISISQNTTGADSAMIRITGCKLFNSAFWVDHLILLKQ